MLKILKNAFLDAFKGIAVLTEGIHSDDEMSLLAHF
jgi:hypothetical protein